MKIMQVMPEFGMAGAEIMCENLMYGLRENGVDVFAVSLYDYHSAITDKLESKGFKIYYLGKKRGFDFSIYKKLKTIAKAEKPDVIHTHRYVMEYAIPIAILYKIKRRIHTVHNIASKEQGKAKRVLANMFYHFNNVCPVALSNEIKKTIVKEYKLPESKVPVVLNGEDLSRFVSKENYTLQTPARIYHIGRFTTVKNQDKIIEVAEKMKENGYKVQFHLVGDCSSEFGTRLQKQVKEKHLEDTVIFDGLQSDIPAILCDADIFILPSEYEGVPMTLIEAMATGLPIIATSVGGVPDMLTNRDSAILLDNPNALYDAIIELLNNQGLRIQLGQNAAKRSLAFSSKSMAEKYISIYKTSVTRLRSEDNIC